MKFQLTTQRSAGIALLVTLAVLLMISIVVVSFSTVVRLETVTAHSSFESTRAKTFSTMAVDEVVAKLRDNIPLDTQWAVGPGRLRSYNKSTGKWDLTPLYSGTYDAGDSATWKYVALNAPSLVSGSANPILSKNREHPTPDLMKVAWINVLQNGVRSTDANYATALSATNPIVGRYAYWVDTETSKVNLNTAGLAKTSYYHDSVSGTGDMQNLTGHPSRVDLSKLDDGGVGGVAITSSNSLATYNYTDSSFWNQDPSPTTTPVQRSGTGGKRFASIDDWSRIGIDAAQIEANKFNLTTQARSPELNPWGLNKWWWQNNAPQFPSSSIPIWGGGSTPKLSELGNRLNAPGLPAYSDVGFSAEYFGKDCYADPRYYVYPAYIGNDNTASKNMQWLGSSLGFWGGITSQSIGFQDYMTNMVGLLSRKDWPGMPKRSFVDKYGLAECEDLAANMMYLYDSTIGTGGFLPNKCNTGINPYGDNIHKYTRPDGTVRPLPGVGPWTYINEVGVKFTCTRAGWVQNAVETPIPDALGVTKTNFRPCFCKPVTQANYPDPVPTPAALDTYYQRYMNVAMDLYIEKYYPRSLTGYPSDGTNFRRSYYRDAGNVNAAITSVEVIATGTFKGTAVTYSGSRYIWGRQDQTNPLYGLIGIWGRNYTNVDSGATWFYPQSSPNSGMYGTIYIGPFDTETTPNITLKFRVVSEKYNCWSHFMAFQIVPLGFDLGTNKADDPVNPTKFSFTCNTMQVSDFTALSTCQSYEVVDPRVYRNLSDWKFCSGTFTNSPAGPTLGAKNSSYVDSNTYGDDSKLTWPDVSAVPQYGYSDPILSDWRKIQSSANIVEFPGIGWLSVLPVNCETSHFLRDLNGAIIGRFDPTPWKTLNFGPATDANELPDWLLIDAFAVAYDQTFLSQTQGKVNINASIAPFNFSRLAPLKALLIPSSQNTTTDAATIAQDIAACKGINSGPCGNLPDDMFVYAGQICQVASLQGNGSNQFQKEAMIRDIAGLVTTQCSDFKVHVIAQSLVKTSDANKQPKVTAERRVAATVSRLVDVGPDEVPGTDDDPTLLSGTTFTSTKLKYDRTDATLEGLTGRPPFRYQVTKFEVLTP